MLGHRRSEGRDLGDLTATWVGVVAEEGLAASPAGPRQVIDDGPDLLGRHQHAAVASVSGLAAPLLAGGLPGASPLDAGRVGGRRPGRVDGVEVGPCFQVGDPPPEDVVLLDQSRDQRLKFRRRGVPEGLRDRRRPLHGRKS